VPGVEIVGKFPEELQQVSSFSAAVMRGAANETAAACFVAGLVSKEAAAAYRATGIDPATG
jgi:molybdate transport system substrate-binding protein